MLPWSTRHLPYLPTLSLVPRTSLYPTPPTASCNFCLLKEHKGGQAAGDKGGGFGRPMCLLSQALAACCWLHRSLSQPRTEISPDTASDRPAPAALRAAVHRHTEPCCYLSSPARFLHFSNSAWGPPPLVTTHSHWPLGSSQGLPCPG